MSKSVHPRHLLIVIAFAASAAACSMSSGSDADGRYSDATITRNVQTSIAALPVDQVRVETADGAVKLNGPAASVQQRAQAEHAARIVPGVQSVTDHLILQ